MSPEWLAPGVVRFNFNSIFLPDSAADEARSHGFVRFSIKLDAGLPAGTQIKNKGYIYFDANPPVVTNTTLNTLQATTNTNTVIAANDVKVYPNPASDKIIIENLQGGKLQLMAITGAVLIDQEITGNKTTIGINEFPNGVYILKIINNGNTTTRKFIKQ